MSLWLAWNEPKNSVFLRPQFVQVEGRWQFAAAASYARICNAIYSGVHSVGGPERVACGATAPRGYNDPHAARPSTAPIAFIRAAKGAGLLKDSPSLAAWQSGLVTTSGRKKPAFAAYEGLHSGT